jgi:hypothetical protein
LINSLEATMKKIALIAGAIVVLGASAASAAGINLSWTDCGTAGTQNLTFACNSNSGAPFTMIGSFIPPAGLPEFLGISAQIDITTDQATVPDWWAHGGTNCRGTTGLSTNFDFTSGPFTCTDFYVGSAAGGSAYDVGFGTPNRARFRIQAAVPFDNRGPLDENLEYYAYKANVLRAKTTGAGSCAGCSAPACIVFNELQLFQPPEQANDPVITNAIDRQFVTWQNPAGGPPGCPASTPTANKSWGQVKSLYR